MIAHRCQHILGCGHWRPNRIADEYYIKEYSNIFSFIYLSMIRSNKPNTYVPRLIVSLFRRQQTMHYVALHSASTHEVKLTDMRTTVMWSASCHVRMGRRQRGRGCTRAVPSEYYKHRAPAYDDVIEPPVECVSVPDCHRDVTIGQLLSIGLAREWAAPRRSTFLLPVCIVSASTNFLRFVSRQRLDS